MASDSETCDSIAQKAGTSFANLRENNPNIDSGCTNIYVGEVRPTLAYRLHMTVLMYVILLFEGPVRLSNDRWIPLKRFQGQ